MTLTRITALTLAVAFASALPASAGAPDDPGAKGELVNERKDYWQSRSGEKNAWGAKVSSIAKANKGNSETNLGGYLDDKTSGPNPANDNSGGND